MTPPSTVELINASASLAGLAVTRGIAYGAAPRQRMDVYAPDGAKGRAAR